MEQELLFVGQEAGKLLALRDIVQKVSYSVHKMFLKAVSFRAKKMRFYFQPRSVIIAASFAYFLAIVEYSQPL